MRDPSRKSQTGRDTEEYTIELPPGALAPVRDELLDALAADLADQVEQRQAAQQQKGEIQTERKEEGKTP